MRTLLGTAIETSTAVTRETVSHGDPGAMAASDVPALHGAGRRALPPWLGKVLRIPLAAKIAGANTLIVAGAFVAALVMGRGRPEDYRLLVILAIALGGALVANVVLVQVALRPLGELHDTAYRIWRGDLDARVPHSVLADRDLQRLGSALNALLDSLTQDRARMRALASQVINAGDRERAHIARELHDSAAQSLAALLLELSVLARENQDPALAPRLERLRSIASSVLDEVKLLAHTVHPRVLDDLGLVAALRLLAREAEERGRAVARVEADPAVDDIAATYTSVLYRVAQEAVNNALRHAKPANVVLRVGIDDGVARLEVQDDGEGFDVAAAERRRPGMGLFTMRERAALVGGKVTVVSERGRGTRVVAAIPVVPVIHADAGVSRPT